MVLTSFLVLKNNLRFAQIQRSKYVHFLFQAHHQWYLPEKGFTALSEEQG